MPELPAVEPTPDQRFQQIAALLAKGVIRHQQRAGRRESVTGPEPLKTSPAGLEVSGKTRLSVSRCDRG